MYTKIGSGQYGVATYLVDSVSDIATLPTTDGIGSAALIPETGTIYMLNNSKQWVEFGGDSDA